MRSPRAEYGERVPKDKNTFSSWGRRLAQRAVHAGWAWAQRAGSVTAEHPGRLRFGSIGPATRLAFPLGTVFGEPWIHLGSHCIVGEQVTLTAGLMPDLDLGPDPILRIGDGVVLGRGSHVIADTTVTIGSDCYFGPYVYVTSTNHSYDDPHEPIGRQWPRFEPVEIGPGCWIGTGAVILPGARPGRTPLDARRGLAAAAAHPAAGADPGRRHLGPARRAVGTGRGDGGAAGAARRGRRGGAGAAGARGLTGRADAAQRPSRVWRSTRRASRARYRSGVWRAREPRTMSSGVRLSA